MKKLLLFICIVSVFMLAFSACQITDNEKPNTEPEDCEHTYSTSWSSNADEHWHKATCDHNDLKSDRAAHVDLDEDGVCDVCEYVLGHEHTYSDTWTTDDTHHWKNAICTHTSEKGELGAHVDSDSNGACDSCEKHMHVLGLNGKCTVCKEQILEVGGTDDNQQTCEHTYSDTWSSDSTKHWHAATCEHADFRADNAPHSDDDEDGTCDVCNYLVGHKHTFPEDEWCSNATHHWKEATCIHTNERSEIGAHIDEDTDGLCDTCGGEFEVFDDDAPCNHTYSDTWSSDATNHWHAATCAHVELTQDVAEHTDSNEDGKCDVCNYLVGHNHTYSLEWSFNESYHWRISTCSHTGEKGYFAAHQDNDNNGQCDDCTSHMHVVDEISGRCIYCYEQIKEVSLTGLGYVVYFIAGKSNLVTGGNIKYENFVTWVSEGNSKSSSCSDIIYKLGNGAAYYKMTTIPNNQLDWAETIEKWYEVAGGRPFGVYKYDGDETIYMDVANNNNIVGHYYAVSTLAGAYGAENLLIELYKLTVSPFASDYNYVADTENGIYSFSFAFTAVNHDTAAGEDSRVDYYELEVSFTASEEGALTSLNLLCKCYTNFAENELDRDYTYDIATGKVTLKPDAVADTYSFAITQTVGTRDYVSEHPRSSYLPTDYSIFSDEELTNVVNGTYTVKKNTIFYLYLGNCIPKGTSVQFAGESFEAWCDNVEIDGIYCSPIAINSSVILKFSTAGTYTLNISVDGVQKTVTIVVK